LGTAAIALALLASAAQAAEPGSRSRGSEVRPDLIYHNYCSVCHGDRGDGRSRARGSLNPPPADFTTPQAKKELTRERMIGAVVAGRAGTAMTSWTTQLSQKEIEAVVDYILGTLMAGRTAPGTAGATAPGALPGVSGTSAHGGRARDAAPAPKADLSAPFAGNKVGNAARGKAFYDANCATCHGATGDGKGPRAYFINPKPRNFLDESARATYNRPALFAAVSMGRPGTEMPAWRKVLDEQQVADVAEYVFRAFIQPPAAAAARKK